MLGALAGDVVGSVYERRRTKQKNFRLFTPVSTFTDDSVLTVAVADAIMASSDYASTIKSYARQYPSRGYGQGFLQWVSGPSLVPYNSFGNGSAMRVSPVAHAFSTEKDVLDQAKQSAECTHNHPEGIKGAQATALAVFLARRGADKASIRKTIQDRFSYDLTRTVDEIRPTYRFDVTCQGSVPEAIIAFLDAGSFEDTIRNAVSLGGDADTQACIAGAIAEAFYKEIPLKILREVKRRLRKELWAKTMDFYRKFGVEEVLIQVESID